MDTALRIQILGAKFSGQDDERNGQMVLETETGGDWYRQGRPGVERSLGETLSAVCSVRRYPGQGPSVSKAPRHA